jgi:hypothetical protein
VIPDLRALFSIYRRVASFITGISPFQTFESVQPLRSVQTLAAVQSSKVPSVEAAKSAGSIPGRSGCAPGLYSYRFDSEIVRSRGFTLSVVGRNE